MKQLQVQEQLSSLYTTQKEALESAKMKNDNVLSEIVKEAKVASEYEVGI